MRPSTRRICSTVFALALAGGAAAAEQRSSAVLWASAIDGTVQIGPGSADFDISVQDLLNVLEGSITLRHESRSETRGWYAELIYNDLRKDVSGPLGEISATMTQTILEFGLSYPLAEDWDMYGGARWEEVDNSIVFTVLPTVDAGSDWADAVLGVRWHRENDDGRYWARADIAGGGSDGAFLFEAGGAWRFAPDWELTLAYRMLNTKFETGTLYLDLDQAGAVFGIGYEW